MRQAKRDVFGYIDETIEYERGNSKDGTAAGRHGPLRCSRSPYVTTSASVRCCWPPSSSRTISVTV